MGKLRGGEHCQARTGWGAEEGGALSGMDRLREVELCQARTW